MGRGVWFDGAHAAGNLVLALAVGPELRRLLERNARRLRTEVIWDRPTQIAARAAQVDGDRWAYSAKPDA
jgi:hypothetical protein